MPYCAPRTRRPIRWFCGLATLLLGVGLGVCAQAKTRLVVYSTLEPDHIGAYKQAFEADNPDIEIALIRDSTGVLTARLIAERNRPQGDAIWGLAVTSMLLLDQQGVLLAYAPKGLAEIKPHFRDPRDPPRWVGMDAWVGALCFNTAEAARRGLPKPQRWSDLADPVFRGQLVMPNPVSSGTGYFHVAAWLQLFGEADGWRLMDRLHENMAMYVHSGSKPCRMAAAGEFAIGVAYDLAGAVARQRGAPVDVVLMEEGAGWDMDAAAVLTGAKNIDAAKRLADWSASRKANQLYSRYLGLIAIGGIKSPIAGYPEGVEQTMIRNDLKWASDNRERILAEWQRRYDGKSEKR
ncbi:MAG TPA: putative 2-aminoethylphosphonate ABC transporter substrate-binding protein [Alphaproteobacteria bacterium]|nr:putative 2-aminoethylphosphonate ABC transporter substrate-binding protein [Alphaproteobacteria bacterium]